MGCQQPYETLRRLQKVLTCAKNGQGVGVGRQDISFHSDAATGSKTYITRELLNLCCDLD